MKKLLLLFVFFVVALTYRQQIIHHLFAIDSSYRKESAKGADIIVFSYDRPMQLTSFLESTKKKVSGFQEIHVIYRFSDPAYEKGYTQVQSIFPKVNFHPQGEYPKEDFKSLVLEVMQKSSSDFVVFAVDDNIVIDFIDLKEASQEMIDNRAYAFHFRLGEQCVAIAGGEKMEVPLHKVTKKGNFLWVVKNGKGLWRYANNLDFTLYHKSEIFPVLEKLVFFAPNTMEEEWNRTLFIKFLGLRPWTKGNFKKLLAAKESKVINLPLNLVNEERVNPHIQSYPKEKLLALFNEGSRIDIDAYVGRHYEHAFVYEEPKFRTPDPDAWPRN